MSKKENPIQTDSFQGEFNNYLNYLNEISKIKLGIVDQTMLKLKYKILKEKDGTLNGNTFHKLQQEIIKKYEKEFRNYFSKTEETIQELKQYKTSPEEYLKKLQEKIKYWIRVGGEFL